ncbi:hypothetical protein J1614_002829 [Plenodomus biglobosus]|nr:hypothetical protein J1614_002829 [Plenodomus biglobosus]
MWPRPLLTTLSEKESEVVYARNQKESPFFQLPGETRNIIYEYAFGSHTIEIDNANVIEIGDHVNLMEIDNADLLEMDEPDFRFVCRTERDTETPYRFFDLLNMTTTCRQIWHDTCILPLSRNRFRMTARTPRDLADHISAWQIDAIQIIEIRFNERGEFGIDWKRQGQDWCYYTNISHVVVPVTCYLDADTALLPIAQLRDRLICTDDFLEPLRETFGDGVRVSLDVYYDTDPGDTSQRIPQDEVIGMNRSRRYKPASF